MTVQLEQMADEIIQTDFLVVGAAISGCAAALTARKHNIDVTVIEKSVIKYCGVTGTDDFQPAFVTDLIGYSDPEKLTVAEAELRAHKLGYPDTWTEKILMNTMKNWMRPMALMEEIGVKLQEDDDMLKIKQTQASPGRAVYAHLKPDPDHKLHYQIYYRGSDLVKKLGTAVLKSGARVLNRTMLTGLIVKDGSVIGATALNIRTGKFIVFQTKTVVLATGRPFRVYLNPFAHYPNDLFYGRNCQNANEGGGHIAAFLAGAKLAKLEIIRPNLVAAGSYGSAGTGGGFYWNLKDSSGKFVFEQYEKLGKEYATGVSLGVTVFPSIEAPAIERDVITFDRGSATNDEAIACYFTAATEWPKTLKMHKLAGGIKNAPITEMRQVLMGTEAMILQDEKGETSLKNLFASGDVSLGVSGACQAMLWGQLVADHVNNILPSLKYNEFGVEQKGQIDIQKKRTLFPLTSKGDVSPLELEHYVRKTNMEYNGIRKTGPRLKRSAEIFKTIKDKVVPGLVANNTHELMRTVEVQNIIELSELQAQASLLRTESRNPPGFYRSDYPEQDDKNWENVFISASNVGGEVKFALEKRR